MFLTIQYMGFYCLLSFPFVFIISKVDALFVIDYPVGPSVNPFCLYVARLSEGVNIQSPAARALLRFPKVSRHPSCMDHAILHGIGRDGLH